MAYTKQNFESGQTLKAEHLNNIENGIENIETEKQDKLVSGKNIKTINGQSIIGSGNIAIGVEGSTAINYDLNVKAVNHRGYSAEAPENTIPAYIMSKNKGFTYVECDVAFTSDGVAVLLHDATIDRTSNGTGNISSMTYEEVLSYDFGSWFSSEYAGTKIPTFTEFIILCKNLGLHPYIELKSTDSYTQAQITQIVDEVEACGMKGKVTYISFAINFLKYVKNADADARLGYLASVLNSTEISNAVALKSGTNEVFMDAKLVNVTDSFINLCISNELPLEVWTVNTEDEIKEMPSYVSGVTSDYIIAGKVLYENGLTYIPPISNYVPATSITLDKTTLTFETGDTQTLIATVEPSDTTEAVVWSSSNESVATVVDGIVTPLTDGNCTITAKVGDLSASCGVTVAFAVKQYSITRNLTGCTGSSDAAKVSEGESYTETFTANEMYTLDGASVVVTMGGVDISSQYINGTLNISSVTGDIVINITAVEIITYSIIRNLTNVTGSSDIDTIVEGESYTETFTASSNSTLDNATVSITMGDVDISDKYVDGTLTIKSVTGNIVINITAILPEAIVNLTLNSITDNTIINNGSGGSTYNATISTVNSSDSYTADEDGLHLMNHAYANISYEISKTNPFTIVVEGRFDELSSHLYNRLFRTENDAPSCYVSNAVTPKTVQQKLAGVASSVSAATIHTDSDGYNWTSAQKALIGQYTGVWDNAQSHKMVFTNDGTTIKYYQDGELMASQGASSLTTSSYIGLGDNNPSTSYYANEITISDFRIYDYAMTAEEVATLN